MSKSKGLLSGLVCSSCDFRTYTSDIEKEIHRMKKRGTTDESTSSANKKERLGGTTHNITHRHSSGTAHTQRRLFEEARAAEEGEGCGGGDEEVACEWKKCGVTAARAHSVSGTAP
jgi:hypothetical protein